MIGKSNKPVLVGLIIFIALLLLNSLWDISKNTSVGENDFVGYWSAAYLFSNGQNPYDLELMRIIQDTKLETSQDSTIMAWNPPPLFVFLLPLAWLPFSQAKFLWIIINLLIVFTATLFLVRIYGPPQKLSFLLACLLFAMFFPPVISGIYMGQVTFLVLFGLVLAMVLIKQGYWYWAGMALILTMIKPHLVLLSLIYLILYMAKMMQFKGWGGIFVSGILCILVLFFFRPAWISDIIGLSAIAPVNWATPTIGGLLSSMNITESARYLIVAFLPLPLLLVWQNQKYSMEFSIALLTLITVPVTFFGWNYDQSILLIPIIQVFSWLMLSKRSLLKLVAIILVIALLISNIYLRALSINDVFYVWIPLFWWFIFALTWYNNSLQRKLYG